MPVSAPSGENVDELLRTIVAALPEGPRYYPADELTDEPERAIVAEIVREKVMLETRDEIPYAVAVTVDAFEEKPEKQLVVIKATIHVARDSQKPIVIGQRGARIKAIGQAARPRASRQLLGAARLPRAVRARAGGLDQAAWRACASSASEHGRHAVAASACGASPARADRRQRSERRAAAARRGARSACRWWRWSGAPTPASRRSSTASPARGARWWRRRPA